MTACTVVDLVDAPLRRPVTSQGFLTNGAAFDDSNRLTFFLLCLGACSLVYYTVSI